MTDTSRSPRSLFTVPELGSVKGPTALGPQDRALR
jgi:hypothetical protein